MLRRICREKTRLTEAEIAQLEEIARQLPLMAELTGADVFIDCMQSEGRAVVVAQARPTSAVSAYEKEVVGEDALAENEPAVFHAAGINAPVCDIKAVTQENRTVRQNVVPIRNPAGAVIAVLIREKDVSGDLLQEKKFEALAKTYESEDRSLRSEWVDSSETTMLREVHHRVKNNLQLVASILNLQARKCRGTLTEKILTENVGRVLSIAALHDILTQNQSGFRSVSSLTLLEKLRANIQPFVPEGKQIRIEVGGDDVAPSANQAGSIALVVNELITNALEHAFEHTATGLVQVSFCAGVMFHTITVADDGSGFVPAGTESGSLGLRIVEATVRDKLRGKLRIYSDGGGTRISFDFKNEIV